MSKMKRCIVLFALCALLALSLVPMLAACNDSSSTEGGSGRNVLKVYNWEDYIDPGDSEAGRDSMINDFKKYYKQVTGQDIDVVYTTFDTNETMMTKVLKNDANVDLICPSEYAIEKLLTAGKLASQKEIYQELKPTLDAKGIQLEGMSSIGNGYGMIEPAVMDVITNMFSSVVASDGKTYDMTEYMVPYMWGTLGILYNKNIISQEELDKYGWGVLWNIENNEKLENKILMKDSVRDTYAAALFYMYEYNLLPQKYGDIQNAQDLINITDDEMLAAAEAVLTEQREHISGYEVDFGKDDMINEIVYADFAWSGDALWAVEESYDEESEYDDGCFLGYYCPTGTNPTTGKERFSNIWYDGWVIPKSVSNKLAAMLFIDFMCRPENAIRNSVAIGYTCAADRALLEESEDVCAFLEDQEYDIEEYFGDIGRYPEINQALGVMRDFGARNEHLVDMWQRAKAGSGVDNSLWIVLAVLVGGVGIAIGVYFACQAAKLRPKKI